MMSDRDRVIARESMEYWAARMPTLKLEHGKEHAELFMATYPDNEQTQIQLDVIKAELTKREKAYIAWLEERMPDA